MLKLLFIPTGNIFTLPDAEVFKIKKQDLKNEYKILDAGLPEQKEEKVSEEEAKKLADAKPEELSDELPDYTENPVNEREEKMLKADINLDNAKKTELVGYARRLGLKANNNETREVLIKRIRETGLME